MSSSIEITCSACGQESLLLREPKYEGFERVGEILKCSLCGHIFDSEGDVIFRDNQGPKIFDDGDRTEAVAVFDENEADALCRHCRHYVVNPFMQWCARHRKEVEATDTCPDFEKKSEEGKHCPTL